MFAENVLQNFDYNNSYTDFLWQENLPVIAFDSKLLASDVTALLQLLEDLWYLQPPSQNTTPKTIIAFYLQIKGTDKLKHSATVTWGKTDHIHGWSADMQHFSDHVTPWLLQGILGKLTSGASGLWAKEINNMGVAFRVISVYFTTSWEFYVICIYSMEIKTVGL